VQRAKHFGWDFVKFQLRASTFAEAFGSVYHPSGHRLRAPILIKPAVPDLDSWASVDVTNRKALDDQVESIGMVVRDLGPDVPVNHTVFSPITVGGHTVGNAQSRVVRAPPAPPAVLPPPQGKCAEARPPSSRRA